jgi:cobalt-zinc-cadmium efflux system outer membrane protein
MSPSMLRAAALAVALLSARWADAAPLSLDQAMDLAVQRSQMARSARAAAAGAAEMARAAGQQPDPMLAVGIDNLPVTGADRFRTTAESMTMRRIGIAQEWVPADKRAAREAVANAAAGRDALTESVAAAEVRTQTAMAYIEAYYAGEALTLITLNEKHAREELAAGKGRLATVSGSGAEVLGLAAALGAAQDESADQRQQQGAAAASLHRWTGVPALALSEPRVPDVPTQDAFVAFSPAVATRLRDIEVARQELAATRLNRKPNWTWEVSYGQRQGMSDLVSFGVRVPLPMARAARQDREYTVLASDAGRLLERIERFQTGVLTPLRQRTAATLAAYRSNQASLVMLFEARHAEVEAQRKLLALRRDLAKTRAQLAFRPILQGAAQ